MLFIINHITKNKKDIVTRYLFTIITTIIRGFLNLFLAFFLARTLGVLDYGKYTFLIAAFTFCTYLLDLASSSAFFTFTSENTQSRKFIKIYSLWVLFQFTTIIGLLFIFFPTYLLEFFFTSDDRLLLILAFLGIFFKDYFWSICSKMAEAQRETIKSQSINIVFVVMQLLVILSLWKLGYLSLELIFLSYGLEWLVACFIVASLYKALPSDQVSKNESASTIIKKFYTYCLPLVPLTLIGVFYNFSDRWMLQIWSGFKEQAFYNISHQISMVSILFTAAALKIFWKEISEYNFNKEYKKIISLFKRIYKLIFFISVFISGIFLPWIAEVIEIALGIEYEDAYLTMFILILYPIHQSLGQIAGVVLLATSRTKIHSIIGIITMIASIIITYIVLAPEDNFLPGLNLGSSAVALKLIIIQIIQVNIMYYFIMREFKDEKLEFYYQPKIIILILSIAFLSKFIVLYLSNFGIISMFVISNIIYSVIIIFIAIKFSEILGINNEIMRDSMLKIKKLYLK